MAGGLIIQSPFDNVTANSNEYVNDVKVHFHYIIFTEFILVDGSFFKRLRKEKNKEKLEYFF